MQSQTTWANTLKSLRENNETLVLTAVSNLQTIFTHDTITLITPNQSIHDILKKHQDKLGNVIIKLKKQETHELTTEQKLKNLFGEKLRIEV